MGIKTQWRAEGQQVILCCAFSCSQELRTVPTAARPARQGENQQHFNKDYLKKISITPGSYLSIFDSDAGREVGKEKRGICA